MDHPSIIFIAGWWKSSPKVTRKALGEYPYATPARHH